MLFKANMVTPDFEVKGCAYIFEQLLRLDLLLVKELLHIVLVVRPKYKDINTSEFYHLPEILEICWRITHKRFKDKV